MSQQSLYLLIIKWTVSCYELLQLTLSSTSIMSSPIVHKFVVFLHRCQTNIHVMYCKTTNTSPRLLLEQVTWTPSKTVRLLDLLLPDWH